MNQKGRACRQAGVVHLYVLVAVIGIITFLLVTSFAPFKDNLLGSLFPKQFSHAAGPGDWPTVGANPQRTSSNSEEVKGALNVTWYKKIDPFIPGKVQIITANNTLYISTAAGLYAMDPANGNIKWIYCTSTQSSSSNPCGNGELPLGHSPTFDNGTIYVAGHDKKLHAIDANSGNYKWSFAAGAGFETNPLVVNNIVYLGNEDGYFYAVDATNGSLKWKFQTGGPILYSAAYKNNRVYFASNDSFAYALDATTGTQVWKSAKLPGQGFHAWWPVVYTDKTTQKDYVVFSGSRGYRDSELTLLPADFNAQGEYNDIFPNRFSEPRETLYGALGTTSGDWVAGTKTLDASRVSKYFQDKPWRRSTFVLDASNGNEFTFDSNSDGKGEYAPFAWLGTHSGNRFPPAIGPDGVFYQANGYRSDPYIAGGGVTGWKFGTPTLSLVHARWFAVDEPIAYSIGGNVIYTQLCCSRSIEAVDITKPNGSYPNIDSNREWIYYDGGTLLNRLPFEAVAEDSYDPNIAYGTHGNVSPPIPYQGKVYSVLDNVIVAFSPSGNQTFTPPPTPTLGSFTPQTKINGAGALISASNTAWPSIIRQTSYWLNVYQQLNPKFFEYAKVTGSDTSNPTALTQDKTQTSVTKATYTFGSNALTSWSSDRAPGILFQNNSNQYNVNGDFNHLAYQSSTGIKVLNNSGSFIGSDMTESWILLWNDSSTYPRLLPMIVSLQKKPSQIAYSSTGIKMTFPAAASFMAVTPLFGMADPNPAQASSWSTSLPASVLSKVRQLNQVSKSFPSSVTENFSENTGNGDVTLTYNYTYQDIADDWGTSSIKLAYLPTDLALAAYGSSPITINGQPSSSLLDLGYPTPLGRIAGVQNSSSATVLLPKLLSYYKQNNPAPPTIPANDPVLAKLNTEVDKMIAAGHLRPGFKPGGLTWDNEHGFWLHDYFSNPSDTILTLIKVLPLLDSSRQTQLKNYIQSEYNSFPLYSTAHVGWNSGVNRDSFIYPPEYTSAFANNGPADGHYNIFNNHQGWYHPPINLYAASLYADTFGGASTIYNQIKSNRETIKYAIDPGTFPLRLNSYIAGEIGYLRLGAAAGETAANLTTSKKELTNLLIKRAALTKNTSSLKSSGFELSDDSYTVNAYDNTDNTIDIRAISQDSELLEFTLDFVNLTPQLASFMKDYAGTETNQAINNYAKRAPFWFVPYAGDYVHEGVWNPLYDMSSIFSAKALISGSSRGELEKYLDVPAFERGDLFYIQNLVSTLNAPGTTTLPSPSASAAQSPSPSPSPLKQGDLDGNNKVDIFDYNILLTDFGKTGSNLPADLDKNGKVDIFDYNILLTNFGK